MCRNLALNRVFPTFLRGRHVFYTWGCLDTPCMFVHPCMFICPHTFICPQGFTHPHMFYILCASVYSLRPLHVVGGCKGPLTCWTLPLPPPLYGGTSPSIYPHSFVGFLCSGMFQGNLYVIWRFFPYVGRLRGVPHLLGFWGH